ncbi:MAG: tRNA pseudouridine(55) synthase TruB [Woeseiaceae bacterium]|jgi:tRNA pseudouridine55 synthase|nr:tRNA pseudouridine(55) synthase TruB [Woeseiaceae bacterium]
MPTTRKTIRRRAVDGVVVLNKPTGLTSNAALQRVKRLLRAKKAGHTGSLDPSATGMLPLCFGEATKASAFLLDADKTYRVVARLGSATDTGDADGAVVDTADVPARSPDEWSGILSGFLGESEQVPPMYSALKQGGRRLYELARQGETVERAPRRIVISMIELLEAAGTRLVFRVTCSKGTYIRTLVEDIARAGGTVAHTRRLHRESVAGFSPAEMMSLGGIERCIAAGDDGAGRWLLPPDAALRHLPAVSVAEHDAGRFAAGQAVAADDEPAGTVRVYGPGRRFLGIGEAADAGVVAPRRIFLLASEDAGGSKNGVGSAKSEMTVDI